MGNRRVVFLSEYNIVATLRRSFMFADSLSITYVMTTLEFILISFLLVCRHFLSSLRFSDSILTHLIRTNIVFELGDTYLKKIVIQVNI